VRQIVTIAIVLLSIFMLGMWGQYVLAPEQLLHNVLQAIYHTMTLFVLEGDWTANLDLPWQLEVTRFLAPLFLITGVLLVLTEGAWTQAENFFIRLRKQHVVVAGLGNRSWQFVQSCKGKHKLVIVEIDSGNPRTEQARKLGMSVVIGDILNPSIFRQVNLVDARHLVAFTGDDGINVELAIKARAFIREFGVEQLLIHMHVDNARIAEQLEDYPKFFSDSAAAQVNFFSVYDLTARILFRDYPPESFAHFFGQNQVHIALYSFGQQTVSILLYAMQNCQFANENRVRFSVFDSRAEEEGRHFLSAYPALNSLCDIDFIETPLLEAKALDGIDTTLLQSVTEHVVCLENDSDNLELALMLRSMLLKRRNCNAPIIVHMEQSRGLAQLLESNFGGPEVPDGLYPFGMLDEVLDNDNVLADGLDILARAFHEDYLERREGLKVDRRLYSTLYSYAVLSEPERSSNRKRADHLGAKLRAIGCSISDKIDPGFSFTDDEALLLAKMEHNRWCAEKIASGWQHGPERIESAKLNPMIGKWEDLDIVEQKPQIDDVGLLPGILAEHLGQGIVRDFRVGITGHRLHKLNLSDDGLIQNIDAALSDIIARHGDRRFIIVSPLAEGADRLVAQRAMEKFGMALHVPLPLPFELYQTDFTSQESIEEFKVMVGSAEVYFELPMRFGNQEELATRIDGAVNDMRNNQYALAGAYITQYCDEMLAIYDGSPEAGVGGTGQIVRWREMGGPDEEFLSESDFFIEPEIRPPVLIEHVFKAAE
jgi:TrkA-N domain